LLVAQHSPDGSRIAFVGAHPSLDPPSQSLWIGEGSYDDASRVARLAEDAEWCDEIFWSQDGERVGFLISGSRVDVYDAAERSLLARAQLVEPDGYPGSREARWLAFTPDARGLTFRECLRDRDVCFEERTVALG
jgi:hypothetical protein